MEPKSRWARLRALAARFKAWVKRKKLAQISICVTSVAVSAVVMRYFLPVWLVLMVLSVNIVHEAAHYIVARRRGLAPRLPFFIAIGYGVLGGTTVPGEKSPEDMMAVALAGPAAGIVYSLALIALCRYGLVFMPGVYASFWLFVSQLYQGSFGSDGRKYRRNREVVAAERDFVDVEVAVAPVMG